MGRSPMMEMPSRTAQAFQGAPLAEEEVLHSLVKGDVLGQGCLGFPKRLGVPAPQTPQTRSTRARHRSGFSGP